MVRFLGYYDYVAFSREGDFEKVDQFAGDANAKTPFEVTSIGNKLGVRFRSNGFINYRGMKLSYVARPEMETNDNGYQISNDDGVCGRSFVLDSVMTEGSVAETTTLAAEETTSAPETEAPEPSTDAPVEETTTAAEGEEVPPTETSDSRIIGHTPAPKNGVGT